MSRTIKFLAIAMATCFIVIFFMLIPVEGGLGDGETPTMPPIWPTSEVTMTPAAYPPPMTPAPPNNPYPGPDPTAREEDSIYIPIIKKGD